MTAYEKAKIATHNEVKVREFDRYDVRVRNALTKLALIKPPKGSDEKNVRKYLRERLQEFGII